MGQEERYERYRNLKGKAKQAVDRFLCIGCKSHFMGWCLKHFTPPPMVWIEEEESFDVEEECGEWYYDEVTDMSFLLKKDKKRINF